MKTRTFISAGRWLALAGLLAVLGAIFIIGFLLLKPTKVIFIENKPSAEIRVVVVTGYSSERGQTDSSPFLTASQKRVQEGFIACPRNIPFGSKVEIEGKIFECQDRMNKRYDNRFDIWFASKTEAKDWGKQVKEVIVYK